MLIMTAWPTLYMTYIVSMAGALIPGAPAAAQTAPEPATAAGLERVIVTAERRTATLDSTPAAITALDGARLAEQGAGNLADVLNLVPNTSCSAQSPMSGQTSTNLALFDTQRVEVLRGPQGALYGRNATGGAINLISAAPAQTFQSRLGVEAGTDGRRQAEGFISAPLGADTAACVIANLGKEQPWSLPGTGR
jgi:outer membrane receptor protein involved in Fe transport